MHGIIFDVDGVIADTEPVNAQASIRMFKELFGVDNVKRSDFEAGLGRGAEAYILAAAQVHSLSLSEKQLKQAALARQKNIIALLEASPLPAFPGVTRLMETAFADKQFKLAIATSGSREISGAILKSAQIPLEHMVRVTGSDVTHKKPHPEIFLTACKRMQLRPSSCLVIEDAPNGVKAANAAGCKCIAVTNSVTADKLVGADLIVSSLKDISPDTVSELIIHSK
ncbi:MAG: HAD family phosphatase [Lentisphaerae bacterium]|nr:HAD family phosphatase [Lentisphaerota bacterium]